MTQPDDLDSSAMIEAAQKAVMKYPYFTDREAMEIAKAVVAAALALTRPHVAALRDIIDANKEFRAGMPDGWEGDPLQDACTVAERLLASVGETK